MKFLATLPIALLLSGCSHVQVRQPSLVPVGITVRNDNPASFYMTVHNVDGSDVGVRVPKDATEKIPVKNIEAGTWLTVLVKYWDKLGRLMSGKHISTVVAPIEVPEEIIGR